MGKQRRNYPEELKRNALELVRASGKNAAAATSGWTNIRALAWITSDKIPSQDARSKMQERSGSLPIRLIAPGRGMAPAFQPSG